MKKTIFGLNTLMVLILLLTACAPAPAPEPTIDANQLFTQAAMTVIAQLTQNAPPATQIPTATKAPSATNTPLGGALPTLPPLATLPPLVTPTRAALNIADKAAYITQSPSDNASVKTGQVFNITWRLRNTGTTTWNQNYQYRFFAAANKISTAANGYALTKTVPPNTEVDLTVVATAPSSTGTYDTQWVLTNPEGTNFALFTLTVNVVAGSSGGSTVATATGVPNACETYTVAGYPQVIADGVPKIETIPGGQARVYFISNTTTNGSLRLQSSSDGFDNTLPTTQNTQSEFFGAASKSPSTITLTASDADIKITKIEYWVSNNNCP